MASDVNNVYKNKISGQIIVPNALCVVIVVSHFMVAMCFTCEEPKISAVRCCLGGRALGYTLGIIQIYTFLETLYLDFLSTPTSKTWEHSVGHWFALTGTSGTNRDLFQCKNACFSLFVCVGVDYLFAISTLMIATVCFYTSMLIVRTLIYKRMA